MVSGRPSSSFSTMEVDVIPKEKLVRSSTQQVDKSLFPSHNQIYGTFGYPQKVHRVGRMYQAEMPPIMSISNYSKLQKNPPLKKLAIPLTLGHGSHKNRGKGHYLVPGLYSTLWDEKEEDIFVLGLYIYGKDFDKVKRLIGRYKTMMREILAYKKVKNFIVKDKTMGDVLSFYYEKLFKSLKHRRWKRWWQNPEIRVFGEHIFERPSRVKLLSRLNCMVTTKCFLSILEAIWLYQESKLKTFEECILRLIRRVSLDTLVEAVGIGKREKDLTTISAYKSTYDQIVPNGKDCSMLTHREIVNILSSFTLSESRSINLFWEAIWPRLKAQGWSSKEQQGSHNYATKKRFFAPRVDENSSKKLEKRKHYFDSISDVLEMVSMNPEMIELPTLVVRNYNGLLVEAMNLGRGNLAGENFHFNHNLQVPKNHSAKTKASTGGKKSIESIPHKVNTQGKQGNDSKSKEVVIGKEYHPMIENRKRKNNSSHGNSSHTRAKLAGKSSHDNGRKEGGANGVI